MSVDLDTIQEELKGRLDADEYFSDIPVVNYREKDLESEIDRLTSGYTGKGGKNGIFVYFSGYFANVDSPDVPGPHFTSVGFNALVYEIPLINMVSGGTEKPALQVAIRVAQVLHHYRAEGVTEAILCEKGAIVQIPAPDDSAVVYRVQLLIPAQYDAPSRVAKPALTADGATPLSVTITCATAGASIYWTDDESYPWSGNDVATLYTAPIALTKAATIRAVAHKSGMIASDAALGIYT